MSLHESQREMKVGFREQNFIALEKWKRILD
jgi:hypothetical protein